MSDDINVKSHRCPTCDVYWARESTHTCPRCGGETFDDKETKPEVDLYRGRLIREAHKDFLAFCEGRGKYYEKQQTHIAKLEKIWNA